MDGPENIPQWPDIKSSSVFNALDDAEKERTRAAYFRQIIEPTLEPGQVASARSQWDELTGPVGPTSITDYGASALSGAASGLGMIFQGGGELLARGVNAVAGTSLRAINPLQGAIDYLQESQTPGAKRAQAQSQISGSLFDPSTYDFGTNPNASGLALQGLNAIGQFAPNLAIAIATSGASIPAQLGIGATVGGLQALGGGAEEERTKFMAMGGDELAASSQLYRDLVANGTKPEVAKRAVAEAAALGGGIGNAIPSAAEGAFENFLIGAITRGRFRFPSVFGAGAGVTGKVATGLVGGAMLGGSEEAVEQIGQNLGVNAAIGGNRQLTADTLQQFVMGAIAEGAAGGGGAYVARNIAQERQAPAIPGASSSFGGVPPGPSPADEFSKRAVDTATVIQSQPTVEAAAGAAETIISSVPIVDTVQAQIDRSLMLRDAYERLQKQADMEQADADVRRAGLINAASKSQGVGPIGAAIRDKFGLPQPETGITTPLPVRLNGEPIENATAAELDHAIQNHPMSAFRVAAEQEKARRAANVDRGTLPQEPQPDVPQNAPPAATPPAVIQPAAGAPAIEPSPQNLLTKLFGKSLTDFTIPQLDMLTRTGTPEVRAAATAEIARRAPPPAPPVTPATAVAPPPPAAPKPLTGTVLQNRDRSSDASVAWMKKTSAAPNYHLAGVSNTFDGAPVVIQDETQIPDHMMGREGRVIAANGRTIPVRYAVVEAGSLLPSHSLSGVPNAGYETGAMGKMRVIAGNGRAAGILAAFKAGHAAQYVADLKADEQAHGVMPFHISALNQPMLVRVMPASEVTPDIGDLSNISHVADLSPQEKATNDARRLDMAGLEFSEDGQITRNAVKQFVAALPDTERSGLIDHAGEPTRQAYDRLTNAVFLQAYGDAELVSLQSQATDPEARTVMTALTRAAPVMMKLEGAESLDIRSVVIEAAKAAVNAKRQGASIVRFAQQVDLTMHPESALVLKFFADNIRSATRIADGLTRAATTAVEEAAKPATDMFGAVPRASRADILRRLSETDIQENLGERAGVETPGQDVERGRAGQPGPADNRPAEEGGPAETGLRQPTPEYEAAGVAPPGAAEAISRHGLPENTAWDRGRGPISDKWAASASGVQSNYHATADAAAKELREFLDAAGHARAADEAVNRAQNSAADKLRRGENPTFPEWKAAFPQLRQGHTYLRQPDIAPFLIEHFGFRRNDIRSNLGEAAGTLTSDTGAQYPIVYFNKLERVLSQAPPAFDLAGQTPEELRAAARARRAEAATKSAAERAAAEAAASALEREAIRQAAAKDGPLELTPTSAVDKATQKALDEKDALDQLSGQGGLFQTRARYEVGAPAPWYYSELARAVQNSRTARASALQWKATIRNMPGVKAEEIQWTGIEDFLDLEAEQPILEPGYGIVEQWRFEGGDWRQVDEYGEYFKTEAETNAKISTMNEQLAKAHQEALNHAAGTEVRFVAKPFPKLDFGRKSNTVTREQIQEFLEQGGVKVTETILGEPAKAPAREAMDAFIEEMRQKMGGPFTYESLSGTDAMQYDVLNNRALREAVEPSRPTAHQTPALQLPGAAPESYRELLLTFPAGPSPEALDPLIRTLSNWPTDPKTAKDPSNQAQLDELNAEWERRDKTPKFTSSHFREPNIIAHVRFNERTDSTGARVLFIEELQSDWATRGRKEGFKGQLPPDLTTEKINGGYRAVKKDDPLHSVGGVWPTVAEVVANLPGAFSAVLAAPFVTKTESYVALVLKRIIRYAVDHRIDKICWTTGAQQVDRYQGLLRKAVDEIDWKKTPDGVQIVGYKKKDYESMHGHSTAETRIAARAALERNDLLGFETALQALNAVAEHPLDWTQRWPDVAPNDVTVIQRYVDEATSSRGQKVVDTTQKESELSDAIGKAMADQIRNDPNQSGTIKGENITVSSTGMAGFYDRLLPAVANSILKKLGGGRVHEITIRQPISNPEDFRKFTNIKGMRGDSAQPGFTITPAMREQALAGQALFQRRAGYTPERLANRIKSLERRVDAAYERGDPNAENLDAQLADLRELEDTGDHEPVDHYDPNVAEELVHAYTRWLDAGQSPTGYSRDGGMTQEDAIANMRDAIQTSGGRPGTDEAVLAAARDAYEARQALFDRRARLPALTPAGEYNLPDAQTGPDKVQAPRGKTPGGQPQPSGQGDLFTAAALPGFQKGPQPPIVVSAVQRGVMRIGYDRLDTPEKAAQAFSALRKSPREHFQIIVTDAQDRPLAAWHLFSGTLAQTSVYPREVMTAIYMTPGAGKVWFAHNHPSGVADPSHADQRLTEGLVRAGLGRDIGVELAGHIIIAGRRARMFSAADPLGYVFDIPAASRKVAIPILERTITRQSFADRAPLNSPDRVRNYLSDEKNRPREPGLLLMDAQNRPLGFWPISVADMGALRTSDVNTGAGRVIQMVGRLNPGAAIAYVPGVDDFTTQRAVANIGSLLNGIDVRMIDGFVVEPGPQGKVTSYAERGFDLAAPTFYSRGDTGATGISVSDLQTAIGEALDQLDTGYTLHANIEEARAATGTQHPADAKAFFDNGRMHFVAANLDSAQDAEEQLWHETLHAGIDRLYGQRGRAYEQALTTIAGRNPNIRTEARQWREDFGEDARRAAVDSGMTDDQARRHVTLTSYEEALARLSGRNAKISGLSQFLAAVQRFLRAVGLTRLADAMEAATDAEALNLVLRARQAVTTRRAAAGPVSSATLETKFARGTPQASAQFKALIDTLGRDDVNAILGDWNDSELSEDGSRIVQYSGRDREFSTGKEGGKHTIPKADFLSWLASDAPFAEIKDPEWRAQIEAARRAAFGEQRGALRIDQTQTPEFKNFFGDWEALRAQGKLDSMMPVSIQIPAGWERLPKTELRQRVADALDAAVRDRAEIVHPELGAIKIGRRGVNKTISASPDPAKLLIANDLANVIPATVVMATQPGNAPNILQRTTLAARVQIGRTELAALVAVNQQEDGRWYYNTVVVEDPQIQTPAEAGAGTPGHVRGATAETEGNPLLTEVANFIRRSLRRVNPALVSKVVDASDKPLAVYNGTTAVFTAFSLNKLGEKTGAADAREGFFFSENPDAAEQFTWADGEKSGSIMPVYLAIKNPFVSDHVLNGATGTIAGKIIAQAKASGHDGVIFTQSDMLGHKGKTYVAFRPEQIKSAIGNTGTFSPTNPDIRYSRGPVAAVQPALNSARQVIDDIITSDRVLNRITSKVNTPFYLAETHPEFKPVYTVGQNYTADTSRYANEAADQAPDLLVRIESFGDFNRTLPTDADLSAIERALHIGTLWGGPSPLQGRLWRDAELKAGRIKEGGLPVFTPLNDAQIKLYRQHLAAVSTGLEEHSKSLIWKIANTAGLEVDHEMPIADVAQNARDAADGAIETLNARLQYLSDQDRIDGHVQSMDAVRASEYRRKQEDEAARVADKIDGLEKLKASVSDIEQKTADLIAHGYTPLMRFGAYAVNVVSFDENGAETEEFFGRYDTQQEANRAKRDLAREFKNQNVRITSSVLPQEAHKLFQGLNLDALSIFAEYMTDDEGRPISENPAIQAYLRLATTERSALNRMIHRKGTPGFSKDVSRGLAQFVVSMAQATSRNYHSASMLSLANDIRAGDLKDYAARYVRYLQDPQEEAQALRGFLAQYYILGSIAFGAVNLTQPILMSAPALSAHTSYANAMREIVRAAGNMVTGRKTLSAEERHAYNRAAKAGKVSPQEIHQLRADTKATMFGASPTWQKIDSLLASRGMKLPGRLLMRKLSFLWGSIYSLTEQFNRGTTFLAAYRIAKQNNERDPYAFAVHMVDQTQGVYNRANRPEVSRGKIGAPLLVFKQFSIFYVELAKRLYDTDKKAFAVLMLTLMALAGAEGLPFAEDIEDIIDTIFQWMGYATNSKKELRKIATKLLGKEMGDVLLHGMSAIPGMPIDVSQRLGMHNLIPGTGLLKTSEADKTRDIQDILGPAASLAKNVGQAVEGVATGHYGRVKLLAPLAIQNILKGVEMGESGFYLDSKGRRILPVDSIDAILKAVGFQPSAVAAETRIVGQNQQDIALQKIIESSIADNWAHGLTDPDPDLVRRSREQLAEWNSKNPELVIRLNQGQILRRVREIRSTREQRFIRSAPPEIRGSVRQDFPQ